MRASLLMLVVLCGTARAHPGAYHDLERETAALARDPAAIETRLRRAALFRRVGQHDRALADLDEASRLGAARAPLELQRGLTLAAMGQHLGAVLALNRSIAASPSWEALVARGRSRVQLGRRRTALEDFDAALAIRPHVEVALERGQLQRRLGLLDEAAAGYRDAIRAVGPATVLVEALVDVELARGRAPAALALIDARLQRDPAPRWLLRRAEALGAAGEEAERAAALERALAEADRAVARRASAINLVSRARVHLARGAVTLARADVENALTRAPGYRAARTLADRLGAAR